jgi:ribonuclease-3
LNLYFLGALFLDGGIEVTDRIFSYTLFNDSDSLLQTWRELPLHPLQEDDSIDIRDD